MPTVSRHFLFTEINFLATLQLLHTFVERTRLHPEMPHVHAEVSVNDNNHIRLLISFEIRHNKWNINYLDNKCKAIKNTCTNGCPCLTASSKGDPLKRSLQAGGNVKSQGSSEHKLSEEAIKYTPAFYISSVNKQVINNFLMPLRRC